MARKRTTNHVNNILGKLKDTLLMGCVEFESYIPSIVEFCESKKYLNLGAQGIKLFPLQRIILKTFYRGQRGNEQLKLTEDELNLLYKLKLDNVIEKYYNNTLFRELVLVLGRRSGKDFMTAIMALYEVMNLLEIPGGSPFKYYDMAAGNPIYILTVATSSDQARILFNEMKSRMQVSDYFKNKIGKIEVDRIWFLTPEDKMVNQQLIDEGLENATTDGSVVILTGHSNSESLLGKRIFTLLLDEVASFKNTGSATSGERIYSALMPATADFKHPNRVKEGSISEENPEGLPVLDSKIISISSPRAEEGIFYRMYKEPHTIKRYIFDYPINCLSFILNVLH